MCAFTQTSEQQDSQHQHSRSHLPESASDSRYVRQSWSARSSSVDQHSRGRRMDNGYSGSDREKSVGPNKEKRSSGSRSGSGHGRGGSRSTSRGRRAELDLIMPQLSLHRSHLIGHGHDHDVDESTEEGEESATRVRSDDQNVERNSIWKSPFRARDRLVANLLGGGGNSSGQNSSGTNTPNHQQQKRRSIQTSEGESSPSCQKIETPSNHSESPVEERPWWQRGRSTKH